MPQIHDFWGAPTLPHVIIAPRCAINTTFFLTVTDFGGSLLGSRRGRQKSAGSGASRRGSDGASGVQQGIVIPRSFAQIPCASGLSSPPPPTLGSAADTRNASRADVLTTVEVAVNPTHQSVQHRACPVLTGMGIRLDVLLRSAAQLLNLLQQPRRHPLAGGPLAEPTYPLREATPRCRMRRLPNPLRQLAEWRAELATAPYLQSAVQEETQVHHQREHCQRRWVPRGPAVDKWVSTVDHGRFVCSSHYLAENRRSPQRVRSPLYEGHRPMRGRCEHELPRPCRGRNPVTR